MALMIFGIMLGLRYAYFIVTTFKISPSALVFISPRGLISILLFLQISEVGFLNDVTTLVDEKVLLVVILASMLVMTRGTMKKTKTAVEKTEEIEKNEEETAIDILMQEDNNETLPPAEADKEQYYVSTPTQSPFTSKPSSSCFGSRTLPFTRRFYCSIIYR